MSGSEMKELLKVKITEVSLVSPAIPTKRCQLPCTTFDLMQKRPSMPYLQRIAFYPASAVTDDHDGVVTRLKLSLAEVLVHFYSFAGRIGFRQGCGTPFIDCNDAGVEFAVATTEQRLEDVHCSQYSEEKFRQLIQRGNYEETTMTGTAPFVAFQLTRFKCGGLALAWSFDHLAIDGVAMMHFMVSWSEISRENPISLLPDQDRSFETKNNQLNVHSGEAGFSKDAPFEYKFVDPTQIMPVVTKIFSFSDKQVQALKCRVISQAGEDFSTFESMAAHIWVVLCKARQLPESRQTKANIAVNCRHRLVPAIPRSYFGNVVLPCITTSTVGEVVGEGIVGAAKMLKKDLRAFGMDNIKAQLRSYNSKESNTMNDGLYDGTCLFIGSSPRHPLYAVDFGWGKPVAVRHGRPLWDGFCFLDPGPQGGKSLDITISLAPLVMKRFQDLVMQLEA